jgi:hypothetical protein
MGGFCGVALVSRAIVDMWPACGGDGGVLLSLHAIDYALL